MERASRFITCVLRKFPYAQSFSHKVKLISWENNRALFELKVEKEHCNLNGTLHGGMASTLVDLYTATATIPAYETDKVFFSTELKMRFLAPAKLGETILLEARVVKAGKTLAYAEMDILDKATRRLLVQGMHTMFLSDKDRPSSDAH
uniref:Thioesterase domain-containing protein n=1 Tax=Ixodes ricinus TaxID=34613 RepID=A0A131Y5D2_IXORI